MAEKILNWTPVNDDNSIDQTVQYKLHTVGGWNTFSTVDKDVDTETVTGLSDNLVYDFRVVNNCTVGGAVPSSVTSDIAFTCPDVAVNELNSEITFAPLGGSITSYIIQLIDEDEVTILATHTVNPTFSNPITYTFPDTEVGTLYNVRVIPVSGDFSKEDCTLIPFVRACDCPEGYSINAAGNGCYAEEEIASSAPTSSENAVHKTLAPYSSYGSYIYDLGWNLNGTGTATRISLSNAFWVNGNGFGGSTTTTAGPMNRSAIWATSELADQDVGFSVCVDLEEETTYYVGAGCDNYVIIKLNGTEILHQDPEALRVQYGRPIGDTQIPFKVWHIYPIVLPAGPNYIEVIGHNVSANAAVGVEVYNLTAEQIADATSYADMGAGLIFSSKDEFGQPIVLGSDNIGYTCPIGYSLDCSDPTKCKRIVTVECGTTEEPESTLIAYWGWKEDDATLAQVDIEASSNAQVVDYTQDITCSFEGGADTPQFLWMAEPIVCNPKTKWQDTVNTFNNGNIGTSEDLFDTPVISGDYRFYITEYVTQQSNPIKFKVS